MIWAFKLSFVVDILAFFDLATFWAKFGESFLIFCGLYYKHVMIVKDDSRVVSK
jgi:hypothetical protein